MKLSKNTIEILQNFSTINQSMFFRKGKKQTTISAAKTLIGVAEFDEVFPMDFGIYNLKQFLNVLSLMEDPEIVIKEGENNLTIKSKDQKVKYRITEPKMIIFLEEEKIGKLMLPSEDAKVILPQETFTKVERMRSILEVDMLSFHSTDGKVSLKTINSEDNESSNASFNLGDVDCDFNVSFKSDSLKVMSGSYTVTFSKKLLTEWKNSDKNLTYFIPADKKSSTFE